MKAKLIVIISFLGCFWVTAQQAINYKALIKDGSGNVVANQTVTVQFAILRGATQNNIYQETHNPTTDANGIIIVNIGEGSTSDDFTAIAWGLDDHFLNVQIDSGDELVDLGTTQFMAVPYALYAESSGSEVDATGLEALDEGNGTGWRFIGRNPNFYGDIGQNATDLSFSNSASEVYGATGNRSFASGFYTTASGQNATAMGYYTVASGTYATAIGYESEATGFGSLALGSYNVASATGAKAMGYESTASAEGATVFGLRNTADDYYATVVGKYNDSSTGSIMFQVGNGGSDASRTNALNVFQNGVITAPTFDVGEITDPKSLVTKEYVEVNYIGVGSDSAPSGLEVVSESGAIGWRMIGRNPDHVGNIGIAAIDLSNTLAIYDENTNGATGHYSFATGTNTTASGVTSFTAGTFTIASGYASSAMGLQTIADDDNSTVVGQYNDNIASTTTLFQIGNGTGIDSRSNAFTVFQNGSATIGDTAEASGAESLASGSNTVASGSATSVFGHWTIADDNYSTIVGRYNDETAYSNVMFQVGNGGASGTRSNAFTVLQDGNAILAGSLNQNSDRRLKEDINNLDYGLNEILKLNPVSYHWKKHPDQPKSLGLIAQEVQPIINEVVHEAEDKDKTLGVSYTELIPVLIKAIQEQQVIIERQKETISGQSMALLSLLERVEALEKQSKRISNIELAKN